MNPLSRMDKRTRRFVELQQYGCLACRKLGFVQPPDIHHQLSGGKRIGDHATIPLCPYHHRGVWVDRFVRFSLAQAHLGPSLALEPKAFRTMFGTDEQLLAEIERHFTDRKVTQDE